MRRRGASAIALIASIGVLTGTLPAGAVVKGTSSSLGAYTVRLVGNGYCSGVVIGRRNVVTAAHCGRGMRVLAGGGSYRAVAVTRSAVLDDGRRVSVTGDAVILRLDRPLPFGVSAAPVGEGHGDTFTIAGYGTTDERARGAFGALHEARLVAQTARALVDPNRTGSIGASGGPVLRGGMLVGIITRAAHPSPRIACGHLTRWAPVTVHGAPTLVASHASYESAEPAPRAGKRSNRARRASARAVKTASVGLFGNWFAVQAEPLPAKRRKTARR